MKSRVESKAIELFQNGLFINKYFLCAVAHCDQRVAQRVLTKLHKNKQIIIKDWCKSYRQWIPIYFINKRNRVDKPKPEPMTRSEISKRYNEDVEHKIDKLMRDRARRTIKRIGI